MGTENKPIDGFKAWKDDIDRRLTQQERRSQIYDGPQLLGPGFGATGTQIIDWNDEDVLFNGYYWSPVDSLNSPDDTLEWAGHVVCQNDTAHGVQTVWSVSDGDPPVKYLRRFENLGITTPTFTDWQLEGGKQGPIGSLEQLDLTSRTSTGFTLDPSTAGTVIGDASAMAYDDGSGFGAEVGIRMDEIGWYEAIGYIQISGTPSQRISVRVNSPEGLGLAGTAYRPSGVTAPGANDLSASSTFYVDTVPSYVQAAVVNPGGATIPFGILNVIKWS